MNWYSRETLRRVEENDDTLIELGICNKDGVVSSDHGRYFTSGDREDYSKLGRSIQRNTNLKTLYVKLNSTGLSITDSGFFEGIKQNSSINKLRLNGHAYSRQNNPISGYNPVGEVGCELLRAFQENNSNLTNLRIWSCDIGSVDERAIINTTLVSCTNLKEMHFNHNNVTDEQLLPMVEAIRDHQSLETLSLNYNRIGNVGCEALATLLQDPNCNLQTLFLRHNLINNKGINNLVNSLSNNIKLKNLDISQNQMDNEKVQGTFVKLLCNTTSINTTHSSNHTLIDLKIQGNIATSLHSLLQMNKCENKSLVAIEKILMYHPNIDMEPLFEWGSKDERNLMALPYVVAWFDRADEAVELTRDYLFKREVYKTKEGKLSAIYQFALAMPLMFIPASHTKADDKKRKRTGM